MSWGCGEDLEIITGGGSDTPLGKRPPTHYPAPTNRSSCYDAGPWLTHPNRIVRLMSILVRSLWGVDVVL